ncbi:hypothetical protein AFLA_007161 [Aspergillus flavus NRRL3357]|nr:hypothetical protein AFLA_007161 [Aspergillus flavus NRRL3357]
MNIQLEEFWWTMSFQGYRNPTASKLPTTSLEHKYQLLSRVHRAVSILLTRPDLGKPYSIHIIVTNNDRKLWV